MIEKTQIKGITKPKQRLLTNLPVIIFLAATVTAFLVYDFAESRTFIGSDGTHYYRYLPELFIEHQLGDYNKYPIGTAILLSPFFFIAHAYANAFIPESATGYTPIYQYAVAFAAVFYFCVGIVFVYKMLKRSFCQVTILITLIAITYGTMLPVYATCSASFSHVYAFAINAIFCYLVLSGNDGLGNRGGVL